MKNSDDLFRLIESLSPSEKRYVRLFAALQGSEKNYMKVFDAIDSGEASDEESMRTLFAGEAFIGHLHVVKRYLYRHILKALRVYYNDASAAAQVNNMLREASILFERGLTDQARKHLRSAERLAIKWDRSETLIPLLEMQRTFDRRSRSKGADEENTFEAMQKHYRDLGERIEFEKIDQMLNEMLGKGPGRSPEETAAAATFRTHPLLAGPPPDGFVRRMYYFAILAGIAYIEYDWETALKYTEAQVGLFESEPERMERLPLEYLTATSNASILYEYLDMDEEYEAMLKRIRKDMRDHLGKNRLYRLRVEQTYVSTIMLREMKRCLYRGDYAGCAVRSEDVVQWTAGAYHYARGLDGILLNHFLAVANIGLGRYGTALEWVNRVIDLAEPEHHRDAYRASQILSILIHQELGNHDLVESRIRSIRRAIGSEDERYVVERRLLRFFHDRLRAASPEREREIMVAARDDLEQLYHDVFTAVAFGHFDYAAWIGSKLTGRPMGELVNERYRAFGKPKARAA